MKIPRVLSTLISPEKRRAKPKIARLVAANQSVEKRS